LHVSDFQGGGRRPGFGRGAGGPGGFGGAPGASGSFA